MNTFNTRVAPRFIRCLPVLVVTFCWWVAPLQAHHSHAMFDMDHETSLTGTVKAFQWTNPHTWLYLDVTDANGNTEEWAIEGGSPNAISRFGWNSKIVQPGDKVTVAINLMKDGQKAGSFIRVTLPNGKTLSQLPSFGPT